jgi:hypothetical protein
VNNGKAVLSDLILYELIKVGGSYESPTNSVARDLINKVLPEEGVGAPALYAALKDLEDQGLVKVHRTETTGDKQPRQRVRAVEFTGTLDPETLVRLHWTWVNAQSQTLISESPDMTPAQQGLYDQLIRIIDALKTKLTAATAANRREVEQLQRQIKQLEATIEEQKRDLAGRNDPSTATAEALVAEAKKEGLIS